MTEYRVVINEEDQYSLWPVQREVPAGWRGTGFEGDREECAAHIDKVWTDMRPRGVRLGALRARVAEHVERASDGLISAADALGASSLAALGLTSMGMVRLAGTLEEEFGLDAELASVDTVDGVVRCLEAP